MTRGCWCGLLMSCGAGWSWSKAAKSARDIRRAALQEQHHVSTSTMRLRTQCLLLYATNSAALQLQPAPQLIKRPHQQPRVILTTEQVEKLERSVAAALPAVGQWAAFGGVASAFSGFLWGYAGLPAAALYASSVASGTAWALAWDHVMPGGGRRVAEMMGGTTVGVPCSVRDAVAKTAAAAKMPAPAAYIVPTKEPNAFAAGSGRDRVVAVTQGLVDLLDRRELEAVVAHEVGHLKHGDTGRAAQAAAMLSGLSTAKRAGDRMLANKRKEKSDASVAASAAGLLLRLAGSRRDEFAADAVAAQFDDAGASRDKLHARAGAYAHAYFSNDDGPSRWLRTHPTVEARVAALQSGAPPGRAPPP